MITSKEIAARVRSVSLVLSILILISGCSVMKTITKNEDEEKAKPQATPKTSIQRTLTLEALQNAEYHSQYFKGGRVKLNDGKYENHDAGIIISLDEKMGFGDVTGDGTEDAVVVLKTAAGGSGVFYDVAVVSDENGVPTNIASAFLGDSLKIESIYVHPKTVVVNALMHGEDDEECCPTVKMTETYTLEGDNLVEQ